MTKLTDLSRIIWVRTTFARMLYDFGVDTVEKVTQSDPVHLHLRVNPLNKEKNIYKGQIGLNDMKILVNIAKDVPLRLYILNIETINTCCQHAVIKHWGLSGYSSVPYRIKFGVTGQESTTKSAINHICGTLAVIKK